MAQRDHEERDCDEDETTVAIGRYSEASSSCGPPRIRGVITDVCEIRRRRRSSERRGTGRRCE
jgi:hypothetical protein